jgi:hypothetical protein
MAWICTPTPCQVIFCSRTHSQLSQFVSELKRTDLTSKVSVVALAARKVRGKNDACPYPPPMMHLPIPDDACPYPRCPFPYGGHQLHHFHSLSSAPPHRFHLT